MYKLTTFKTVFLATCLLMTIFFGCKGENLLKKYAGTYTGVSAHKITTEHNYWEDSQGNIIDTFFVEASYEEFEDDIVITRLEDKSGFYIKWGTVSNKIGYVYGVPIGDSSQVHIIDGSPATVESSSSDPNGYDGSFFIDMEINPDNNSIDARLEYTRKFWNSAGGVPLGVKKRIVEFNSQ